MIAGTFASPASPASPAPRTVGSHRTPLGRTIVFGFVPALDGVRAVAVLGVLLYHGGAPMSTGGFLGVNMFFVLSGFLITSLLLGEWARRLTIRLGQFWARRARRLLPALLLLLVGVAAYARFFATPGEFATLRLDSLATLFYVANWHFVVAGTSYFAASAQPSPLSHMWSLAIEEQFYLVWPPVVLALLHLGRRLRPPRRLLPVLSVAVVGALASAADMRWSFLHGATVTRLYEGTDTRCQDILVGAVLATGLAIWAQRRRPVPVPVPDLDSIEVIRAHPSAGTAGQGVPPANRRDLQRRRGPSMKPITAWELSSTTARMATQLLGWAALSYLIVLWDRLAGPTRYLFVGGELLVAVAVAAVLFAIVTAQAGSLARVLALPPLVYLGKISYGVYLWHFPLFALLNAGRMHLYGVPLLAVRLAVTLAVATASYYLVEQPVRQGRLSTLAEWRSWLATSAAFLGVVAVTVAATLPSAAEGLSPSLAVGTVPSGPPVRVAVLGDSVAWRLGFSLLADAPEQTYGVDIDNGAIVACGVMRSSSYEAHGVPDPMATQCNPASPSASQWPAQWAGNLVAFHPNVVMILAGRWEVMDRWIAGRWAHIGEPLFDAALRRSLEQAVQVSTAHGAYAVLLTAPCFNSGEQPNGLAWPEDSATRLAVYNAMVRRVAAEHPATVRVEEFGAMVCPGGTYATTLDGVQLRDGDGVHIVPTVAAGRWLADRLLPQVVQVGRLQQAGRSLAVPATTPSTGSPPATVSASGAPSSSGTRGP